MSRLCTCARITGTLVSLASFSISFKKGVFPVSRESINALIRSSPKYEKRIPAARENFRRAGREERITLLEGDAADILKDMEGSFDLIFMDAAKGQYIHFLKEVLRLMPEGGLLLSDNVLQDGDIIP